MSLSHPRKTAAGGRDLTFPDDAHVVLARIRPGHFWFENRRRALREVLRGLPIPEDGRALDVGCGDGYLLDLLPGRLRIAADRNLCDVVRARRPEITAVVAAAGTRLPFRRSFHLVCAFDVVEHVEDDVAFLRECASVLEEQGRLVLTAPAGPELWSTLDEYAGHYRRYTRKQLSTVVGAAGLVVEQIFPLFRLLWPLARLRARIRTGRPVTDPAAEYATGWLTNILLRHALALEWTLLRRRRYGRGTSWCVVARGPSDR